MGGPDQTTFLVLEEIAEDDLATLRRRYESLWLELAETRSKLGRTQEQLRLAGVQCSECGRPVGPSPVSTDPAFRKAWEA